jgi:CubicO group peptidase (beta-lactamase class C family)
MIVRLTLILGIFFLSCSGGTSQGSVPMEVIRPSKPSLSAGDKEKLMEEIKAKYEKLLGTKGFSGQILVAKNGEILFEDYKGFSNYSNKTPILPETPIHLASISKTFTGMAALKLWEQNKLDLKAPVTQYLPKFPYSQVTIEQLLSHRSGLPSPDLDVLRAQRAQHRLQLHEVCAKEEGAAPGRGDGLLVALGHRGARLRQGGAAEAVRPRRPRAGG